MKLFLVLIVLTFLIRTIWTAQDFLSTLATKNDNSFNQLYKEIESFDNKNKQASKYIALPIQFHRKANKYKQLNKINKVRKFPTKRKPYNFANRHGIKFMNREPQFKMKFRYKFSGENKYQEKYPKPRMYNVNNDDNNGDGNNNGDSDNNVNDGNGVSNNRNGNANKNDNVNKKDNDNNVDSINDKSGNVGNDDDDDDDDVEDDDSNDYDSDDYDSNDYDDDNYDDENDDDDNDDDDNDNDDNNDSDHDIDEHKKKLQKDGAMMKSMPQKTENIHKTGPEPVPEDEFMFISPSPYPKPNGGNNNDNNDSNNNDNNNNNHNNNHHHHIYYNNKHNKYLNAHKPNELHKSNTYAEGNKRYAYYKKYMNKNEQGHDYNQMYRMKSKHPFTYMKHRTNPMILDKYSNSQKYNSFDQNKMMGHSNANKNYKNFALDQNLQQSRNYFQKPVKYFQRPTINNLQNPTTYPQKPINYLQNPTTYLQNPTTYLQKPMIYFQYPMTNVQQPSLNENMNKKLLLNSYSKKYTTEDKNKYQYVNKFNNYLDPKTYYSDKYATGYNQVPNVNQYTKLYTYPKESNTKNKTYVYKLPTFTYTPYVTLNENVYQKNDYSKSDEESNNMDQK